MLSHAQHSHQPSKGIISTFYTILIALIATGLLILILVLFIQRHYNQQIAITSSEQSRDVINLAQALISSNQLAYVDGNNVLNRGVIDASKAQNLNMNDLRSQFTYNDFYYDLSIQDLHNGMYLRQMDPGFPYQYNPQLRSFPIAIRNNDGTVDGGVITIKGGFG